MRLSINRLSALQAIRAIRDGIAPNLGSNIAQLPRTKLLPIELPDGRSRWSASCVDLARLGLPKDSWRPKLLSTVTSDQATRIQAKFTSCSVYSSGLPDDAFIDAGNGLAIASPELVFLEMSTIMEPPVHVLLGYELTGRYSRDYLNPRTGNVTFDREPATSVNKIRDFLNRCHGIAGIDQARQALKYVRDNSWSPTESLIAAFAILPVVDYGYSMGEIALNQESPKKRRSNRRTTEKDKRIPDIMFVGTPVGINYDGTGHLDLDRIEEATMALAKSPDDPDLRQAVETSKRGVREKVVDDIRRNRELASRGLVVIQATSEDLYREHGLDNLMEQVMDAIEAFTRRTLKTSRTSLANPAICKRRQALIWALLDWEQGRHFMRDFLEREKRGSSQARIEECTIVL